MVLCCAYKCQNRSSGKTKKFGVTFHRLPTDEKKKNSWIDKICRINFAPSSTARLCSEHFEGYCFDRTGSHVRLIKNSIPTIFTYYPGQLEMYQKKLNEIELEREIIYVKEENLEIGVTNVQQKPLKSENTSDSKHLEKDDLEIDIKKEQLDQESDKEEKDIYIKEEPLDYKPAEEDVNIKTMEVDRKCDKTLECSVEIQRNTNEKPNENSQFTYSHKRYNTQLDSRDDKPFECFVCQKRYISGNQLRRHVRSHNEKLKECPICLKQLNASHMRYHMKSHTGEKLHECSICQKQFITYTQLKVHMNTHTKDMSYKGKLCDKKFSYYSSIQYHMKSHSGEKPHECLVCQKRFIMSSSLKRHMRQHTGERPYECSLCHRKFAGSEGLQYHILRNHIDELPYDCSICKKKFVTSSRLKIHKRTHKGESCNNVDGLNNSEGNVQRDDNNTDKSCNNVD